MPTNKQLEKTLAKQAEQIEALEKGKAAPVEQPDTYKFDISIYQKNNESEALVITSWDTMPANTVKLINGGQVTQQTSRVKFKDHDPIEFDYEDWDLLTHKVTIEADMEKSKYKTRMAEAGESEVEIHQFEEVAFTYENVDYLIPVTFLNR